MLSDVTDTRGIVMVAQEVAKCSLDEAQARTQESELLRVQKSAVEKQASGVKMHHAELNDRIRELESQLKASTKSNTDLREQLATRLKVATRHGTLSDDQATGAASSELSQTGEVKRVGPQDGDIELSVRSGAGLAVGLQLFVFRTKPRPEFLGTVSIVAVRPKGTLARVVGDLYKGRRIEVGDVVSSTIKPPF